MCPLNWIDDMTPMNWVDEFTASFTGSYVDLDSDVNTSLYMLTVHHVILYVTSRYTPYALFELQPADVEGVCYEEDNVVGYDGLEFWPTVDL